MIQTSMSMTEIAVKFSRKRSKTRFIKGLAMGTLGFCTSFAVDGSGFGREWLEVVELDLAIPNLPPQFEGKRIVHISDLHCGRTVSKKYLQGCIERINQLEPDIIVLTGDYVTYDTHGRFQSKVAQLLGGLHSSLGVYACLGNHDYGKHRLKRNYSPQEFVKGLHHSNVRVLRNQAMALKIRREKLWLVGLGDLLCDDCDPHKAFATVPSDAATITLVHNPEAVDYLEHVAAETIMCGHTHGAKMEGANPTRKHRFRAGLFDVKGKKLYVNRGLGRLGRPRFNCRPEITVYTLS
ncbi:MAG: metallophosphoesterase [Sedimentisphaerales bacterium]|nr:metallophosphoesterase [Sedimentisphaerales bacterium]